MTTTTTEPLCGKFTRGYHCHMKTITWKYEEGKRWLQAMNVCPD